jgi:FKBP-type peptidyl-prolyl cis-trans isomerase SlyD
MKIGNGVLVSLSVKMADAQGNVLEQTAQPLVYLHGSGDIFPAVEEALEGQEPGYGVVLHLEPEQAFGDYDPDLVFLADRKSVGGGDVQPGMQLEGRPGVAGDTRLYTITDVADETVVLDGNHPLAGLALQFDVRVLKVESAENAAGDERE